MDDFATQFDAVTPPEPEPPKPAYALVEIFGHRQHYGEIRDVEIAGGKLLEVRDVDTETVHMYGAAAIFSLTPLTQGEIDAHIADQKRRREEHDRWKREREARVQARLAAPDAGEDDGADEDDRPF
jgi:hypothetical protein